MSETGTPRWWVSWYEPSSPDCPGDYRPVVWPLRPSLLGWWKSGFRWDRDGNEEGTLCALLECATDLEARELLELHWPGWHARQERFFEGKPAGWAPDPGRFAPAVRG